VSATLQTHPFRLADAARPYQSMLYRETVGEIRNDTWNTPEWALPPACNVPMKGSPSQTPRPVPTGCARAPVCQAGHSSCPVAMRARLVPVSRMSPTSPLRCPHLTPRGALDHVAERPYLVVMQLAHAEFA
jgi:hypothetical protein